MNALLSMSCMRSLCSRAGAACANPAQKATGLSSLVFAQPRPPRLMGSSAIRRQGICCCDASDGRKVSVSRSMEKRWRARRVVRSTNQRECEWAAAGGRHRSMYVAMPLQHMRWSANACCVGRRSSERASNMFEFAFARRRACEATAAGWRPIGTPSTLVVASPVMMVGPLLWASSHRWRT